jgi:hypothetical protein
MRTHRAREKLGLVWLCVEVDEDRLRDTGTRLLQLVRKQNKSSKSYGGGGV